MNLFFRRLSILSFGIYTFGLVSPVHAQISSDGTLVVPTSVKSNNNLNFTITNGTQAGSNLFHSFQEFSIPTNGSAVFEAPDSVNNIIGRVTGNNPSFIDGLLKTTGQMNLFFLNPNCIILALMEPWR